jgi:hypothetical protein
MVAVVVVAVLEILQVEQEEAFMVELMVQAEH